MDVLGLLLFAGFTVLAVIVVHTLLNPPPPRPLYSAHYDADDDGGWIHVNTNREGCRMRVQFSAVDEISAARYHAMTEAELLATLLTHVTANMSNTVHVHNNALDEALLMHWTPNDVYYTSVVCLGSVGV